VKLTAQEEEGLALESASFPPFMLDMHEVVDSPVELPNLLPHEMNKSRKLLFETVESGYSGLSNRRVRFCRDQQQLGVPPGFDEVLLLQPSDVWTVE
jgi:hypothetical protein